MTNFQFSMLNKTSSAVIPAKAGIYTIIFLDSRLCGNDKKGVGMTEKRFTEN